MANKQHVNRRQSLQVMGMASLGLAATAVTPAAASNWPRLDKALAEMNDAKKFLENARTGFGGHRKKAIEALTVAIKEIEEAIKHGEAN